MNRKNREAKVLRVRSKATRTRRALGRAVRSNAGWDAVNARLGAAVLAKDAEDGLAEGR